MTSSRRMLPHAARSGASYLLMLAFLFAFWLGSAGAAHAQFSSFPVHDQFNEGNRFTVKNLSLDGQGNRLVVPAGGTVQAEMDIRHNCRNCGAAVNQIIVGLGGAAQAQACVWQGGASSGGWKRVRFALHVPDEPGTYQVRVRYAQAYNCHDALDWWRVDRPEGPSLASNIGLITVARPVYTPAPPPPGAVRDVATIMAAMDRRLARMEKASAELDALANARQDRRTLARIRTLSKQMSTDGAHLRKLQSELATALAHGPGTPVYLDPPVVLDPPVTILPVPHGPPSMSPREFDALVHRLRAQGFEQSRMNMLEDAVRANAYFDISQALRVMELFGFSASKVEAATLLCRVMVEPGALPSLIAALSFESDRDTLRRRTGGRCGPM